MQMGSREVCGGEVCLSAAAFAAPVQARLPGISSAAAACCPLHRWGVEFCCDRVYPTIYWRCWPTVRTPTGGPFTVYPLTRVMSAAESACQVASVNPLEVLLLCLHANSVECPALVRSLMLYLSTHLLEVLALLSVHSLNGLLLCLPTVHWSV